MSGRPSSVFRVCLEEHIRLYGSLLLRSHVTSHCDVTLLHVSMASLPWWQFCLPGLTDWLLDLNFFVNWGWGVMGRGRGLPPHQNLIMNIGGGGVSTPQNKIIINRYTFYAFNQVVSWQLSDRYVGQGSACEYVCMYVSAADISPAHSYTLWCLFILTFLCI